MVLMGSPGALGALCPPWTPKPIQMLEIQMQNLKNTTEAKQKQCRSWKSNAEANMPNTEACKTTQKAKNPNGGWY